MKSSRQAKKPNGGTTRIDRLAGIAGELTDAEQRENVPRRQRRSSPVGNKRKSASPVPAPREAAETSPTEDDAPNIGTRAGRRARKTARKSTTPVQLAAAAAENIAAKKDQLNIAKEPRGRPRKVPQPVDNPDATAVQAATHLAPLSVAAQPAPAPAAAQPVQAPPARIAHPAEFEDTVDDLIFVNAAPPAQVQQPPPQPQHRPQFLALPPLLGMGPPFAARPPVRAPARNRAVPPAAQAPLRERAAPPLQPPQPARALPPRVVHHTDIMADSDCEHDSANSTVSPVARGRRRASNVLSPGSIEEWPTGSPAAAAAVPVDIGGAQMEAPPQPVEVPRGRRVAHTDMLRFGPALPLAPRIPKALTETRTAANRARDSTEDDNTPPDSAAEENVPAEAAQGEQAAAAQNGNPDAAGAGPAVHNRAAPTPAGSSDTAADLDLEADLAPEQDVPNDGAEALVYPNSYRRARRDRTRSLNRMAQRLPQLPPVDGDAVLIRPPPMRLPQKAPASAGPQTPAGLPIRAELGSGKNATINTTGRTAQEKDKAPAVDSVAAAWQLNGMAGDEAGPSDPRAAGDSSEANSAAKAAHNRVGKESSPRKRRRSSGAFSGASPQKCLRISASGAMAVSMAPTPEKVLEANQQEAAEPVQREEGVAQLEEQQEEAGQPDEQRGDAADPGEPLMEDPDQQEEVQMDQQEEVQMEAAQETEQVEEEEMYQPEEPPEEAQEELLQEEQNEQMDAQEVAQQELANEEQPVQEAAQQDNGAPQEVAASVASAEAIAQAAAALQATAAAQLARPQPAGPSRDDLNKQLLQRLKEEADLGIEAMQSHTLFRLSEEGLEHLAMQRGRQQRIKVSHDRQVLEVSRLLKTSTAASKIVQETQERIKELQQALRGYIAAAEVSRVEAVAAMRSQAIIKEDMENAVRDVAGLLGAKPADIEHLTASMAAQHAHVGVLRGAHEEISRKLQFTRDEKARLLRELDSRDDADAA